VNAKLDGVCKPLFLAFLFLLLAANCVFGQATPRVVEAVDNTKRVTLAGNVHPLARVEYDRGAVDSALPMARILMLLQRGSDQEAALQTFMEQQQDKSSPNYHVWFNPQQFGAQYGPADSDIQAVTQWLQSQGFTINKVYNGKTIIEFSGSAGQVQTAFGVNIHNYQVNNNTYVANANDPQIPAALAPVIAGIVSLNNFPRQSHIRLAGQARKIPGRPGLQPLFTVPNSSGGDFYAVGPADFATIYNSKGLISAGNDGTGQTIAVVGETNINVADVQAFRKEFGLSNNFTSSNIILNGEDPGITSVDEEGEADLDVQWSGAVAPGADIAFVVSESTAASAGIDLSALYIIEYNLAGVMSESYGACEAGIGTAGNAFYNTLWEQAAAQGITAILSAGDAGSAACDDFNTETVATQGLAVSGLASTPYNVAMGGTDFDEVNKWSTYWSSTNNSATGESALSYIPEIPWNQNCAQISLTGCGATASQGSLNIVAGSGGSSTVYSKPEWQMGVTGMPNDSHRDLPDLSLFASSGFDGSGYVICPGTGQETGASQCNATSGEFTFAIVGGTSASTPAFAGIMALVNQYQSSHGGSTRQGNANYPLYSLSKKSGASCTSSATEATSCIFNDVTHGNSHLPTGAPGLGTNSVPCQGGTPNCSVAVASENGVLVEPTNSAIEAWTVTAGYDLTTGLGSVNVNNLATQWGTVNTVATTTTLTLNPTTGITHGTAENVTVNVTVTPTTGTATGDVSLIATIAGPHNSTSQGLNQYTLNSSGKVVNATTDSLPGGTAYQVHAHYAGNGTNAPSDSAPVTVTVGKETSQTFIVIPTFDSSGNQTSGNITSVAYGSKYIIQMYVTDKNGVANPSGPPAPLCYQENSFTCPSGTVTLTDNGNPLGTGGGGSGIYNLNNTGYTRYLTPNLSVGTHTLAATYNGDNSYQPSPATTVALTVVQAATSELWTEVPTTNIPIGQQISVVVVVGATVPGPLPTGSVTFYDGNAALAGTVTYSPFANGGDAALQASGSFALSTAGTHSITAKYSGDSNYAPSTSSPITIVVVNPTTGSVTFSPSTVNYGSTVTITAVIDTFVPASNSALKPTGTISLYASADGPITTGVSTSTTADPSGNWEIQATVTITPSLSETFTLNYPGDNNYQRASVSSATLTVIIPDFTLGPTNLRIVPAAGQPGSGQITVTPLNQTPSTVNLALSPALTMSGYNVALNPQQVTLNGAPATATLSLTPTNSAAGASIRRKVHLASLFPVQRGRGGTNWLPLGLTSILTAVFVLGFPGRRKKYMVVLGLSITFLILLALGCGGGSNGGSGGSGGATTITLTTTNAKTQLSGTSYAITATVTSTSGKPLTGIVNFYNFGTLFVEDAPVINGQAQLGGLAWLGVYQLTAEYTGDTYNAPSKTASALTQTITGVTTVNIQGNTGGNTHLLQVAVGLQ
jgi:hypothetical protein